MTSTRKHANEHVRLHTHFMPETFTQFKVQFTLGSGLETARTY